MQLVDNLIISRAHKAIKCLPFNSYFYSNIQKHGLNAESTIKSKDFYIKNKFREKINVDSIEEAFRWLIIVGILRREVDGQGLTSKVRLTPLWKELLDQNPNLPSLKASFKEKIITNL